MLDDHTAHHASAWPLHSYRHGIIGMGIADGVYQWREQGIDAGEFSRLLMHTALEAVEEGQPDVLKGLQLLSICQQKCPPHAKIVHCYS